VSTNKKFLQCKYEHIESNYSCDELALANSDFCIFHSRPENHNDPNWIKNVQNRFNNKFRDHNQNSKSLLCIGYYFPSLQIQKVVNICIDFTKSHFLGVLSFKGSILKQELNFSSCTFHEEVDFVKTTFYSRATFVDAEFKKQSIFIGAQFLDDSAHGVVNFSRSIFHGESKFSNSIFNSKTSFFKTIFLNNAEFTFTTFRNLIASDTKFLSYIHFHGTEFYHSTFAGSKFLLVDFSFSVFHNEALFVESEILGTAHFHHVRFSIGESIVFKNMYLKNVSFLNTNITRIRFINVIWMLPNKDELTYDERVFNFRIRLDMLFNEAKNDEKKQLFDLIGLKYDYAKVEQINKTQLQFSYSDRIDDYGISLSITLYAHENRLTMWINNKQFFYPDLTISGGITVLPTISLEEIVSLYNDLRENYEYYLRYETAGNYFKKIMALQHDYEEIVIENNGNPLKSHKRKSKKRANLSLNEIYHLLSDYGESYSRPLGLGMSIVFIATVWFYIKSNILDLAICFIKPSIILIQCIVTIPLAEAFKRTVIDFLPFSGFTIPNPSFEDIILKVLGFGVFGLLFIALRRKFERRFRH
jgi:uncharacterized protein YjbI with pentapeptide repeats